MYTDSDSAYANSRAWRVLAWIGVGLQLIALIFVLWAAKWGGAWTIALFLGFSIGFLLMQDRMPSLIDFIVVMMALVNAGGWAWEWYQAFAWFDEFVHAFSLFAIVSALAYIGAGRGWMEAAQGMGRFVLLAAATGLGLGILWEIVESFFLNLTFWDTIVDLVMDTLGAAAAGWFVWNIAPRRAARR